MKKTLLILLSILVVLFAFVACEESVDYVLDGEPGPGPGPGPTPVHVTSVSLNKNELIIAEGESETLTATVLPSDATDKSVTWTSNKPAVAKVDDNGKVTGVAAGTATITVTTKDGGKTATCDVTVKTNVKAIPLTLDFTGQGAAKLWVDGTNTPVESVYYSLDGGTTRVQLAPSMSEPGSANIPANAVVTLYRTIDETVEDHVIHFPIIKCDTDCYVYGNIMSLFDEDNYSGKTDFKKNDVYVTYVFNCLFFGNTHIKNHPTIELVLPATTLSEGCYQYMFSHCSNLTAAPELPAETLSEGCYREMFSHCSNLTAAPELPAETLSEGCYQYMFMGCSNLTAAPALPAETLSDSCYRAMFANCTSLETSPVLHAPTLVNNCYYDMFNGCANLSSLTCLATDITAENCVFNWLKYGKTTGVRVFYKNSEVEDIVWTGTGEIPAGWSIQPYAPTT